MRMEEWAEGRQFGEEDFGTFKGGGVVLKWALRLACCFENGVRREEALRLVAVGCCGGCDGGGLFESFRVRGVAELARAEGDGGF